MKTFPTLYHKTSKGKINVWDIWADGDTIYTKWGQQNGKLQEAQKKASPKNVGKANETSASEQAELEAESMWKHKLERKYVRSLKETEDTIFLPMLAKDFEKRKRFLTEDSYPVSMQAKLDGVRCLASWKDGKVHLMSRGGKTYNLPHISEELEPVLEKGHVLDGEIYLHGATLQEINRLVRRVKTYNPECVKVEYRVYDYIVPDNPEDTWTDRHTMLGMFFASNKFKKVVEVDTYDVPSEEAVYELQGEYIKEGYEGAVVRLNDGVYKFGYRSDKLLKVKSFQDAEFEIVDYTNGVGKFENCIIYVCETEEGSRFNVVPKGTFEERKQWLDEGDSHIGQMLKVKFADWTEDNVPQFPVGICIRLPEDM